MDVQRGGRARLAAPAPPRGGPRPGPGPRRPRYPRGPWLAWPGRALHLALAFTPAQQGTESRSPGLCAPGPGRPRGTPPWA